MKDALPIPIMAGYTVAVRDPETVRDYVPEPTPPKNYTKQATIQKWMEENYEVEWGAWEQRAPWLKATGTLKRVILVDVSAQHVFDSNDYPALSPGGAAAHYLLSRYPDGFRRYPRGGGFHNQVCFYAFNPKPLVRLMWMDAIREGHVVPIGMGYQNEDVFDPKEMLVETSVKDKVTLDKLCHEAPGGQIDLPPNYLQHESAQQDLLIVAGLCLKYQLVAMEGPTTVQNALVATYQRIEKIASSEDEEVEEEPEEELEEELEEEPEEEEEDEPEDEEEGEEEDEEEEPVKPQPKAKRKSAKKSKRK